MKIKYYLVIDMQTKEFIFGSEYKQLCEDHIFDVSDKDLEDTQYWVIREVMVEL